MTSGLKRKNLLFRSRRELLNRFSPFYRNPGWKLKLKGVIVSLTTHLIQEADELCDRVAIIAKGRVRIIDTPTNLRNQAQDTEVLEIKTHPGFPSVPKEMESFPEVERVIF